VAVDLKPAIWRDAADYGITEEQQDVQGLPDWAQEYFLMGRLACKATGSKQVFSLGGGGIAAHEAEASTSSGAVWTIYALSRGRKEAHPTLADWAAENPSSGVKLRRNLDPDEATAFCNERNRPQSLPCTVEHPRVAIMETKQVSTSTLPAALIEGKHWDGDGVPLKESNCARIGSDEDKAARKRAATMEPAWNGAGTQVGLQVWRIENFQVVPWPKELYGEFMMGDSYIVLSTIEEPDSGKLLHDIHFWLGRDTTADEMGSAAYKTVELDDYLDGEPHQHREVQYSESQEFHAFFPNLSYKKGGQASAFRKASSAIELYEHRMYRVRKMHAEGLQFEEVALHRSSLNEGDVFIVDAGAKIYVWEGQQSSPFEKNQANSEAERLESKRDGRAQATHDLDDEFWELLGGRDYVKAAEEVTDATVTSKAQTTQLYQISDSGGKLSCCEVGQGQLLQSMLRSEDVMMLVTVDELFLWIGSASSTAEGRSCYRLAMDFLKVNKRPMDTPIHLFKEGQTILNERWLAAFTNMECSNPHHQWLRDAELHEPAILEGSVCIDQNAATSMVKVSDAATTSIGSVTLEPTDETALGNSSEDNGPKDVFYSLAELVDPTLWRCKPDVVERPHEREQFLAPDIFEVVFGMAKDDFAKLPTWRQSNLKKQHQFF